jgi:hypothetical protein
MGKILTSILKLITADEIVKTHVFGFRDNNVSNDTTISVERSGLR